MEACDCQMRRTPLYSYRKQKVITAPLRVLLLLLLLLLLLILEKG